MTFKKNFIAVVKNRGKILRERNGVVTLPFSTEYSLLLKNLESRKALVNVSIDGEDVLDGQSLIVQPNSNSELKGFLRGRKTTNKFKFIRKTKEISDYRGDKLDDGIVRVEFKFEREDDGCDIYTISRSPCKKRKFPKVDIWERTFAPTDLCEPDISSGCYYFSNGSSDGGSGNYTQSNTVGETNLKGLSKSKKCKRQQQYTVNCCDFNSDIPFDDEGITVKGSRSNQSFDHGYIGSLESKSSVITIRLRGTKKNGRIVNKPLTVRSKLTCSTCGKKSKSTAEFCSRCGTFLE